MIRATARGWRRAPAFLLGLLLLAGGVAFGFNTLKSHQGGELNNAYWPADAMPVPYLVDVNGAGVEGALAAVQAAFAAWDAVPEASIRFSYAGVPRRSGSLNEDGLNQVEWITEDWEPALDGALAVCPTYRYTSGEIYEAGIAYNGQDFDWTTQGRAGRADIQAVGTHEAGHFLGLDHSIHRDAVMYWAGDSGQTMRDLTADDIRGVTYLYPVAGYSGGQMCDTCQSSDECAGADSVCVDLGDEGAFCGQACDERTPCPDGAACYNLANGGHPQCLPNVTEAAWDRGLRPTCAQAGGFVQLGDYCWGSETCESGICLVTLDHAFCSQSCNRGACPAGYECMAPEQGGFCVPPGPTPLGDECESHLDCETLLCAVLDGDAGQCTASCNGQGSPCPAGSLCSRVGVSWFCRPVEVRGSYGDPCAIAADCASGVCQPTGGAASYCSQTCDAQRVCPGGDPCRGPAGQQVCIPGGLGGAGESCEAVAGCLDGLVCYADQPDGGRTCRARCDPFGVFDCEAGEGCRAIDSSQGVCLPLIGAAPGEPCTGLPDSCRPDALCLLQDERGRGTCLKYCSTTGGRPVCAAGRTCRGIELDGELGVCPKTDSPPGTPCETYADCGSALCIDQPTGRFCSRSCDLARPDCPAGLYCAEGVEDGVCLVGSDGEGEGSEGEGDGSEGEGEGSEGEGEGSEGEGEGNEGEGEGSEGEGEGSEEEGEEDDDGSGGRGSAGRRSGCSVAGSGPWGGAENLLPLLLLGWLTLAGPRRKS